MDVKTAGRTLELFELFAKAQGPLTLSEIARSLAAPQSSCFNLLRALEARGYLYPVGGAKRLYPTRKLLDVAEAIAGSEPVVPRVASILQTLRNESQETIMFGARQGNQVVYLNVIEGPQVIRYTSRAGELKPMHASSIGKALLFAMDAEERAKLVKKLALKERTATTITSDGALLEDLERSAARGYTATRGENVVDVMAVAVPITIDGTTYGVAIAGPIPRMETHEPQHVAAIRRLFRKFLDD